MILETMASLARDHDSGGHAKIVACFVRRGKILAYGFNSYTSSHPFQKRWQSREPSCFWHAETHCIWNALKNRIDLTKGTLYIYRAKRTKPRGEYVSGLAKPCKGCFNCIKHYGVKEIIYTTDKGFCCERVQDS